MLHELTGPIREFLDGQEDGGAQFIATRTELLRDALRQTVEGIKKTAEQN